MVIFALLALYGCPALKDYASFHREKRDFLDREQARQRDAAALTLFSYSQFLAYDGRGQEAVQALEEAVKYDPGSAYLREELAFALYQQGRHEEALQRADEAVALDPGRAESQLVRGMILLDMEKFPEAEKSFREACRLNPDESGYAIALADSQLRQGRVGDAIATLDGFAANHPEELLARYYVAAIYLTRGELDEARRRYQSILQTAPSYYLALSDLARLEMQTGNWRSASEAGYALVDFYPDDAESRILLVSALLHLGEDEEALRLLEQGKTIGTPHPVWWNQRGFILLDRRRYDEAADEFDSALAIAPQNGEAVYGLGLAAFRRGNFEDARAYFESIPEKDDSYFRARRMLVTMELTEDRPEAALAISEKLYKERSYNLDAIMVHTWALREAGRAEEAEKIVRPAHLKLPDHEGLILELALSISAAGREDEAIGVMEKLLAKNPKSVVALNFIGYALAEKGERLGEAKEKIESALALAPAEGWIMDSLGWVYFKLGDYERALAWLLKADSRTPDDGEIMSHLGDCRRARGDKKAAEESYGQALKFATGVELRKSIRRKLEELG